MMTIVLFVSCSDDSGSSESIINELEINKESFNFPKGGGEDFFYIQSSSILKISCSDLSWCSVNEESSSSKVTRKYKINISENKGEERQTKILVSDDKTTKQITVIQDGDTFLDVSKKEFNISGEGETISLTIKSSS